MSNNLTRMIERPKADRLAADRKTIEKSLPFEKIFPDGVMLETTEGKEYTFSKLFKLIDINYQTEGEERQLDILTQYCSVLNTLGDDITAKLIIFNRTPASSFAESMLLEEMGDGDDELRRELNSVILDKLAVGGEKKRITEKYFLVAVKKPDKEAADRFFRMTQTNLQQYLMDMGSGLRSLTKTERLRLLHDIYRCGHEDEFSYDPQRTKLLGFNEKHVIAPMEFDAAISPDYMKVGDKFVRNYIILDYPSSIDTNFVKRIMSEISTNCILTVTIVPIDKVMAIEHLDNIERNVEKDIERYTRKQVGKNNFNAQVPYSLQKDRKNVADLRNAIEERDQGLFFLQVSMSIFADDEAALDIASEKAIAISRENHFSLVSNRFLQEQTFNNTLPYGNKYIDNAWRDATSDTIVAFNPFVAKALIQTGGRWFGNNRVTGEMIYANIANLDNGNCLIFGASGAGKSFYEKIDFLLQYLNTGGKDTDFLIIDPEREWQKLAEALGGDRIVFSASSNNHINPLALIDKRLLMNEDNIYVMKADFLQTIVALLLGENELNPRKRSLLDRAFKSACKRTKEPTLTDVYDELSNIDEDEARELMLGLEMFVTGSLNLFAQKNNVERKSNFTVFDTNELGSNLREVSSITIMETIFDIVAKNNRNGRRTVIVIEEFHIFSKLKATAQYMDTIWRRFRKYGAHCVGSTQAVEDLAKSIEGRTLIENSDFTVILKQKDANIALLKEMYALDDTHCAFIRSSARGEGLLLFGDAYYPFEKVISPELAPTIYGLISTKPESVNEY